MDDTYVERFQWILKEGLVLAAILVFWHAVAVLFSQGLGNIGMTGQNTLLAMVANQLATAAIYAGIGSAVLYLLARTGTYLIDYYRE